MSVNGAENSKIVSRTSVMMIARSAQRINDECQRSARVEEMILEKPMSRSSRCVRCIGVVQRNCKRHCSWRTGSQKCACWVPRCLTEEHKNQRFDIVLSHLQQFKVEGNEFLESKVTGGETWVRHFTPGKRSWNGVETPNFFESRKVQSVSVCGKSYGIWDLGYKRSRPRWIYASGHKSQRAR
jgi:hypothetical protein